MALKLVDETPLFTIWSGCMLNPAPLLPPMYDHRPWQGCLNHAICKDLPHLNQIFSFKIMEIMEAVV